MKHISLDAIKVIRDLEAQGNPGLLVKMIGLFEELSKQHILDLKSAISAKDQNLITKISHSFKSSAANLGAKDLAALCRGLEMSSRQAYDDSFIDRLGEIETETAAVLQDLIVLRAHP